MPDLLDTSATLAEWEKQCPCMARCLSALGIDPSQNASQTLADVCREHALRPEEVLDCVLRMASVPAGTVETSKTTGVSELAEQIVTTHHEYLRRQLPWMKLLLDKALQDEPRRSRDLRKVAASLGALDAELREHMIRQEQATFPRLRSLEATHGARFVGEIDQAAQETLARNEKVMVRLAELSEATHGFRVPVDATAAYRSLIAGLAELRTNLEQHFRAEIGVLFPRAIAIEAQMRSLKR